MIVKVFNNSQQRVVSQVFIQNWMKKIVRELKQRKIKFNLMSLNIDVVFVIEKEMKRLNKKFRSHDKVTDVLSFSARHSDSTKFPFSQNLLGELVLCPQYVQKKARKKGVSVREETAYLLLHGFLHLLGYDHEKSLKEAQKMYRLQDQIFDKLYE